MQLPFSVFLALKYLRPKRTFISVVSVLSVVGVMLGVAVLVIVLSVMSGFDVMWREKILGFNAHLTISGPSVADQYRDLVERIEALEDVVGAAPSVQGLVFLKDGPAIQTPVLRGVDPELERRISKVPEHMVGGSFDVIGEKILLGSDLARRMGVGVGDVVLAFSPQAITSADEVRLPDELEVAGVYELGMWDYDMGFVLTSLDRARDMIGTGGGVESIQAMTVDPYRVQRTADAVRAALGPDFFVQTWMDQNRQLFAALRVEKNMMFFLLIFIVVVAAFGITNTLITVTVQKTREIGLLKALGFASGGVMRVFLWQGLIAGLLGTAAGIGLGLVVLEYRNALMQFLSRRFGWELFPKELYHLSEIPAATSPGDLLLVGCSAILICTFAGMVPAWRAARLDPVKALRYE